MPVGTDLSRPSRILIANKDVINRSLQASHVSFQKPTDESKGNSPWPLPRSTRCLRDEVCHALHLYLLWDGLAGPTRTKPSDV